MTETGHSPPAPHGPPSAHDLLAFERLLSELSATFINLPAARIDAVIESGLRRVVETLDIDRSTLTRLAPDTGKLHSTHSWAAEGVLPTPTTPWPREAFSWLISMGRAGKPLVFSRLSELPLAASAEKRSYESIGIRSHVAQPLVVGGELVGFLGFACTRRERAWPEDLVAHMRALADVFASALARKRAQEELDHALSFERLLADLSASMLRAPSLDVARVIPEALQAIGEFLGVDRVSLWRLMTPHDDHVSLIHAWYAAGMPALPAVLHHTDVPWLGDRLLRGEVVRLNNPGAGSDDATADGGRPPWFGTRSLLSVPLLVDGNVAAVLSLGMLRAERNWPDALVPRVRLIGEVLANVLERDRRARQLAEAQGETAQFRERLAHVVRVHTVGEMSAALAHEIAQPLGAIENYALAARRRAGEASPGLAKVVELLDKVIGQATRAGDVVMRLRGLVKRHDLELKELDVGHAVGTCIDMVKTDCELHDIRIELKTTGTLPRVVADEIHVQQVILNLLRNAMDAMSVPQPGVRRTVTVETAPSGPDMVTVQVADRGPGIPEGDLERVFEPFYSTKAAGLGVGLSICRKLIEAHGGTLSASHNPGGGAVFHFTLPLRAPEA